MAQALHDPERRFALVISSPRERAKATAEAIAGRLDEVAPALDVTSDEVLTQAQFDAFASQSDVARFLASSSAARRFAETQLASWESVAKRLPDNGKALLITHGGTIELAATPLARELGARLGRMPMGYCEGVRIHYLHGRAVALERLGATPNARRPTAVASVGRFTSRMPTVHREKGYRFGFRAVDREEPPHVHAARGRDRAKLWLEPEVSVARRGRYSDHQIDEIVRITERHRQAFLGAWRRFFR